MILADDSSPTILEIKQDLSVENEEEYHLIIQEDRIQIISNLKTITEWTNNWNSRNKR